MVLYFGLCDRKEKAFLFSRHHSCLFSGILFVVDSSDKERLPAARVELMRMCKAEELKGIPLIVMANKQDVEGRLAFIYKSVGVSNSQIAIFIRENITVWLTE